MTASPIYFLDDFLPKLPFICLGLTVVPVHLIIGDMTSIDPTAKGRFTVARLSLTLSHLSVLFAGELISTLERNCYMLHVTCKYKRIAHRG